MRALYLLPLLPLLGLAACPSPQPADNPETTAAPDGGPSELSPDGGIDLCSPGGNPDIVLGRVAIESAGKLVSWLDIEVDGPEHDALRACEALARKEVDQVHPPETRLSARVVRPCSTEAMAEPRASASWLLVDRRALNDLDVTMAVLASFPQCPDASLPHLHGSMRRLGQYDSKEDCEKALEELRAATSEARKQAMKLSDEWLEKTIHDGEERLAAECGADAGAGSDCAKRKAVLEMLRKRKDRAANEKGPEGPEPGTTQLCRPM